MPPKSTISQQQVLDAALNVIRSEGLAALSARRVARELGCSTQPVYRAYASMEQLREDALDRAQQLALERMLGGDEQMPAFLQVGLGSLHFARDEPELFKAISLAGPVLANIRQGKPPPDFVLQRMRAEAQLAGLSEEQLCRIHNHLWFFSQGLTSLFLSPVEGAPDPMDFAEVCLLEAGRAVIEFERSRSSR